MHPALVSFASGGLLFRALRGVGAASTDQVRPLRSILLVFLVTWVPLLVLSVLEGTAMGSAVDVPFLHDPAVHARLLVSVPLLILAEVIVSKMARGTIEIIRTRRLIADEDLPALDAALERLVSARDSIVADVSMIALVAAGLWFSRGAFIAARVLEHTSWIGTTSGTPVLSRAGWWFFLVSFFVSGVLALRWAWWVFIWTRFLLGFLRPRLVVSPGHPDQHGGLAFLTMTQGAFALVFTALAATVAGRLGYEMLYQGATLAEVRMPAIVLIVFAVLVMFGPLVLFAGRLGKLKRGALMGYDALGQGLVADFERKWLGGRHGDGPLLGDPDPSTLADFATSYAAVRQMRPMPIDLRRAVPAIVTVAAPFLPLLLLAMSLVDILKRMLKLLM